MRNCRAAPGPGRLRYPHLKACKRTDDLSGHCLQQRPGADESSTRNSIPGFFHRAGINRTVLSVPCLAQALAGWVTTGCSARGRLKFSLSGHSASTVR